MEREAVAGNQRGQQGISQNECLKPAANRLFPSGGVMQPSGAKLHRADCRAHGKVQDAKFRVCLVVYVVQDGCNCAKLQARKANSSVLPESGWQTVFVELEQFCINIGLQAHMAAVVTAVLFLEICLPVYIGMTVGVQGIMSQKSGDIRFCNPAFLAPVEYFAAV